MKEKLGLKKKKKLTEDGAVTKVAKATKKRVKRHKPVDVSSPEVFGEAQDMEMATEDDSQIPTINNSKKSAAKKKVQSKPPLMVAPPTFDSDSDESEFGEGPSRKFTEELEDDDGQNEEMEQVDKESSDDEEETFDSPEEQASDEQSDDSGDEEVKDLKKFRESMANLPLSEVRAMKEKLGIKLFNKAYFGTAESDKKKAEAKSDEAKKIIKKRVNQHRPLEVSSKKKVSVFRDIYTEEKKEKKRWDPRFDQRAGEFKEGCFDSNYAFLDDMRNEEKEQLKNELSECLNSGDDNQAERLAKLLKRMEDQEKSRKEKQLVKSAMHEIREENIERMMQGQAPVFKTKAQVRGKIMEKKFDQLKKENKLDSYMKRKAKQDAQKAKKSRPDVVNFEQRYGYQS